MNVLIIHVYILRGDININFIDFFIFLSLRHSLSFVIILLLWKSRKVE